MNVIMQTRAESIGVPHGGDLPAAAESPASTADSERLQFRSVKTLPLLWRRMRVFAPRHITGLMLPTMPRQNAPACCNERDVTLQHLILLFISH